MTDDTNWKEYFDNLAENEVIEHKKVGWGSNESMYSRFHTALKLLSLKGKERLLDIGCGTAAFEELVVVKYPALEIHAIDISEKELHVARRRNLLVNFKISSIIDIPYPDSFFNCVTCFGVLQNFNGSLILAITEMVRVLKAKGDIFITTMDNDYVGFKSGERKPNPMNTYYVPEELNELLESKNITVVKMGAISSQKLEGLILPLHQWHTFYVWGQKNIQ